MRVLERQKLCGVFYSAASKKAAKFPQGSVLTSASSRYCIVNRTLTYRTQITCYFIKGDPNTN